VVRFSSRGLFVPHSPAGRWFHRARLAAAALCLLMALVTALGSARTPARPAPERTAPVVVAARDLPAGSVLRPRDLTVRNWPARLRPDSAVPAPTRLVGARLAGPLARGEPVTEMRVLGRALTSGLGPGTVAVSVDLPASGAAIARAGDYVDLLAGPATDPLDATGSAPAPARAAQTVVRHALVLSALHPPTRDASTGTNELVLAVPHAAAARIAGVAATRPLFAVVDFP
jgi:Flp pilus assembly protein CpaB